MRPLALLLSLILFSLILLLPTTEASAKLLQIVHTNDLHSHLDHAENPSLGGYAAVKATMDAIKMRAEAQGIETLTLDSGDFTEGSEYYLADHGSQAWRAMSAMGYDAVTLGNHDWFMGERELNDVVGRVNPSFPLLAANFIFRSSSTHLTQHMRQWVELKKSGIRIGIIGLTTDDVLYEWMMQGSGGFINDIEDEAKRDIPGLRARNDLVIALTHIGTQADKRLVQHVPGIDLVVGGHCHTRLVKPVMARNPSGGQVPIVQTGMHGESVGDLLVDVEPGKPVRIVHYDLVPVQSGGPKDDKVEGIVKEANDALEADYGHDWLNEVVGVSEVPLENPWRAGHSTHWGNFVAEAMRKAASAEVAIDSVEFSGQSQPAGPITRRQLFILYPRVFDFSQRFGWNVWSVDMSGWMLKLAIEKAATAGMGIDLAGITFHTDPPPFAGGKTYVSDIRINGEAIQPHRNYKVAAPEGIVRGGFGISKLFKFVMKRPMDTGVPIWRATETLFREVQVLKAR
jgi:5'-nucleotidase/UDP-sugar diphosphatase